MDGRGFVYNGQSVRWAHSTTTDGAGGAALYQKTDPENGPRGHGVSRTRLQRRPRGDRGQTAPRRNSETNLALDETSGRSRTNDRTPKMRSPPRPKSAPRHHGRLNQRNPQCCRDELREADGLPLGHFASTPGIATAERPTTVRGVNGVFQDRLS